MAKMRLPDLSPFELQCLRRIARRGDATVRQVHNDLPQAPSYSTVRTIVERLEEKGAVARVRKEGKAWVYRSTVAMPAIIRKEIRRFLELLFDGAAAPLVSHLADMEALTLEDLESLEKTLKEQGGPRGRPSGVGPRAVEPLGGEPPAGETRAVEPLGGEPPAGEALEESSS